MADRTSTPTQEVQTFICLENSIDRMFNEFQAKFLADAKLLLEKAFEKSIDFPVAISQSCEELDKSSLVIDFAEPMVQVSEMEASTVVGLSDSTRNLPWQSKTESLISEGCGEPNEGLSKPTLGPFAEPKLESWVTVSNEDKVFDRLPMAMGEESDDLVDLTKTLLELPQDKSPILEGCDNLTRGWLEGTMECVVDHWGVDEESREKNQLVDRNTPIDTRNRLMPSLAHGQGGAGMIMIYIDKFTRITSDWVVNEVVELNDPYKFRLLMMGNQSELGDSINKSLQSPAGHEFNKVFGLACLRKSIRTKFWNLPCSVHIHVRSLEQQNCKAWSCLQSPQPLSVANSSTLVELVDNASGRERRTVTTRTCVAELKNWQNAIKIVVQKIRRRKKLGVTKCELTYHMVAPLKDMKHLAATFYILEMMNGNFLEEEMDFCNLDCLETIIAARNSGNKNEISLILLRTSPSSLQFQQVSLEVTDNRGCTYIIGAAPEPWGFTMEEKDQWYSVVDEAQLHSDERNDTYEDLQMKLCCPPLLYGRTMGLLVEVINSTTIRDSFGLTYDVSFELSLFDQLKLGWLAHVQTPSILSIVLMRCLLIGIDKICELVVAEGSINTFQQCSDANKTISNTCNCLLFKLAGSDSKMGVIVEQRRHDGKLDIVFKLIQERRNVGIHTRIVAYSSLMRACNNARNFDLWRTLIAKGSSGDNVPVGRFISLIEFYLTLLMVDLKFGKKGIEFLDIIVNQLRTKIDGMESQLFATIFQKIRIPIFGMENYELNGRIFYHGEPTFANVDIEEMSSVHAAIVVKAKRAFENIWSNHLKKAKMVKGDQGLIFKECCHENFLLILEDKDYSKERVL